MEGAAGNTGKLAVVAALVVVAAAIGANAVPVVHPSDICGISIDDLMSCKPAVAAAAVKVPQQGRCCTALKLADLTCLCSFSSYMPMFGIDPDHAMELPVKCHIIDSFHC